MVVAQDPFYKPWHYVLESDGGDHRVSVYVQPLVSIKGGLET